MAWSKTITNLKLLADSSLFQLRHKRRVRNWVRAYQAYRREDADAPPLPAVLQLIPTEKCNLRCKMCNQWGDNGYFLQGVRQAKHSPDTEMCEFLDRFSHRQTDFLLSLHGGEPLAYPALVPILDIIKQKRLDTIITTNGTLISKHAEALASANRHIVYLLSIDGDDETNDLIRGTGVTEKIRNGIRLLNRYCASSGTGAVKIMINFCVTEHNIGAVDAIDEIARELNVIAINYNLRWYLPESSGLAYDGILQKEFNITGSGAWQGWQCDQTFNDIPQALAKIYHKHRSLRSRLLPPYVTLLPRGLSEAQAGEFYSDYAQTFGIEACIMPSYQVRIHSNGEMIFCPGHPDVIAGNVFREDFATVYYNQAATHFRQYVEKRLLPICNRCCGLYMTYEATQKLGRPFIPSKPR